MKRTNNEFARVPLYAGFIVQIFHVPCLIRFVAIKGTDTFVYGSQIQLS